MEFLPNGIYAFCLINDVLLGFFLIFFFLIIFFVNLEQQQSASGRFTCGKVLITQW